MENGDRGQSTREVAAPAQCAWRAAPHDLAYQCSPVPSGRRTSGYVGNSAIIVIRARSRERWCVVDSGGK